MVYQHDPRHVDELVKDLGLENGNDVTDEEPDPWTKCNPSEYRWQVAECVPRSRTVSDVTSVVKSDPTHQAL